MLLVTPVLNVICMKKIFLVLALLGSIVPLANAQLNLAGRVTDEHNKPIAGATLLIKGTNIGTRSAQNGDFTLTTAVELPLLLTVSFIGYQPKNVPVRGSNFRAIAIVLDEEITQHEETFVAASRMPEVVSEVGVTAEKINENASALAPVLHPFNALQKLKGVDLLTQSLTFQSVAMRGFGSTTNSRVLVLNDGMDNRSPGLGYGFGNVAGIPDLDIETIEVVPGASAALYGPDAMQGLISTRSKSPFDYEGLSARVTLGVNNIGKTNIGPRPYTDFAIRYAKQLNDRLAVKLNFQRLDATDFIADNYGDRQTRDRANGLNYVPNSNAATNFQYDGVNTYGDEISGTGSSYTFPKDYANVLLQNRQVTRTGYTEFDLLGTNGKVFNNKTNASLHYKLPGNVEASVGWYYGSGNFIGTTNFRNYFPDYQRHQIKAEIRGENFFVRAYTTQQKAEAWSIGQTATAINNGWKSLGQWAAEFGQAYVENKVTVGESRLTANRNQFLPGSARFISVRDAFANTFNTDSVPGYRGARGTRFRDNSALWHYEGMYNFTDLLGIADVTVGGNVRHYALKTGGTLFARKPDGSEYGINEYGAYVQATNTIKLTDVLSVKPTLGLRYDKNQYLKGVFSPKATAVVSFYEHHIRASWQTAFHNPVPGQLFAVPGTGRPGEVGGSLAAMEQAGLGTKPAYYADDVNEFLNNRISAKQLSDRAFKPEAVRIEQVKTWEVGYKTQIQNRASIDILYFQSRYTGLLTTQTVYQPTNGQISDFAQNAYRSLQVNVNSTNDVLVRGWAVGGELISKRDFVLSGNFAHQVGLITLQDVLGNVINDNVGKPIINQKMSSSEVARRGRNYFNSPENRYNLMLSNTHLTDRVGASVAIRWTDKMWYEQGVTAGDVWLPSWSSLDAQVSYKMPALKSVIKIGGTNVLNKYYAQGYGLAQIGGLYYVSLTFDELMR